MLLHPSHDSNRAPAHPTAHARQRLRDHALDANGFTLIELLTVILIIGILAAISLPIFLSSTAKAVNAQAQVLVRNAETAAEAIATENNGSYEKVSKATLHREEPALRIAASPSEAYISKVPPSTRTEYSITAKATNGDEFTIKNTGTEVVRECLSPVSKTGCNGAEKSTW